mgnify:FL=1
MTTFNLISEIEVEVDRPLNAQTFLKLRENPLAIAEGDSSASEYRYQPASFADSTCTSGTQARQVSYRITTRRGYNGAKENARGADWKVTRRGAYAVSLVKYAQDTTTSADIMVNGSSVFSVTGTGSGTAQQAWYVINVEVNDLVRVDMTTDNESVTFETTFMYVYTDNPISEFETLNGIMSRTINTSEAINGAPYTQDIG